MKTREAGDDSGSQRTCIVSGEKGPPEAMLRFALSSEGVVVPDVKRKLPGRGVWTRLSFAAVRQAAVRKAFSRAFRTSVAAPPELAETVDSLLERDALQSLSLANKAGLAVAGAFKVEDVIAKGDIAALIQASDGASDGAAKRERALRARHGQGAETVARINLFSSGQLSLALGKANVIHAALKAGPAASAFVERAERLRRYRMNDEVRAPEGEDRGMPGQDAVEGAGETYKTRETSRDD